MLNVLENNEYTITRKAHARIERQSPALVAVSNKVFAIAGKVENKDYFTK